MYFGHLLPMLALAKMQLHELLECRPQVMPDVPVPLVICQPLVQSLFVGIDLRFGEVFDDVKVNLAAIVLPQFKLDWIDNDSKKAEVIDVLKRSVRQRVQLQYGQETQQQNVNVTELVNTTSGLSTKGFFARYIARDEIILLGQMRQKK